MRHRSRSLIALSAVAALGLGTTAAMVSSASAASSPRTLGLSSNGKTLTKFDLATAKRLKTIGSVTGLSGDTKLIGIDYRVQNKRFYGVGNQGGVYTINSDTGVAAKDSQLSVALDGSADFAVDFNPAADRLRIISAGGQNLRHDIATDTTTVDTPLAFAPTAGAPAVTAVAYTNNDLNPTETATTLFDLDTTLDQLYVQSPANNGTLAAVGKLGLDASPIAGLDILTTSVGGRAVANTGYATLRPATGGATTLYRVDLSSGRASRVGTFTYNVADLAIAQP